jgi:hypothetical protein
MGDVLDGLGYRKMCCRKQLLTFRTMEDVIAEILGENLYTEPGKDLPSA